ncbi:hypothetical protein IZY60_00630 [Lutibacter sp. B2]|nr:hypothetical protein [Lutibacter sp. B2]
MKIIKKTMILFMIFCLLLSSAGCTKSQKKPSKEDANSKKAMPEVIKSIEKDILLVMQQVDLTLYFNRSIEQKKQLEKEMLEMKKILKDEKSSGEKPKEESSNTGEDKESQKEDVSKKEPNPLMFPEMVLQDILKNEKVLPEDNESTKAPTDINETWKKINTTIISIHNKFNILEPLIIEKNAGSLAITKFKDTLDQLTNYVLEKKYFETITLANQLTLYLPEFMAHFETKIPPTAYTLKFYTRDIVLKSSKNDYKSANNNINELIQKSKVLKSFLTNKNSKPIIEKFDAALVNFQNAVKKHDINLIKINAAIVMKNIVIISKEIESKI